MQVGCAGKWRRLLAGFPFRSVKLRVIVNGRALHDLFIAISAGLLVFVAHRVMRVLD